MRDGEDWLLAPVNANQCKMESLLDGTISLVHIAMMNEARSVEAENQHRYIEAMRTQNGR
jgi:hypothetical protein